MEENNKQVIQWDVSAQTIIKIIGVFVAIFLIYFLRDVLISLFIAVILMSAIAPMVGILKEKTRLSTISAISITYITTITIVGVLLYLVIPPLLRQLSGFLSDLPRYAQAAMVSLGITGTDEQLSVYRDNILPIFTEKVGQVAQGAFGFTIQIFSGIIEAITIAVFTFYLLLEREQVEGTIIKSLPFIKTKYRTKYKKLVDQIQIQLGHWARGQLILCIIIGVTTYIGLVLLGVPYALPLAVIAGILEIVPTIGPIISSIPAIIIVLALDPTRVFFVIILYLVIQQLENTLIVPQVMKRAIGFSPLLTIVAIMIGGRLLGIPGALLAVPFTSMLFVILQNYKKLEPSSSPG